MTTRPLRICAGLRKTGRAAQLADRGALMVGWRGDVFEGPQDRRNSPAALVWSEGKNWLSKAHLATAEKGCLAADKLVLDVIGVLRVMCGVSLDGFAPERGPL